MARDAPSLARRERVTVALSKYNKPSVDIDLLRKMAEASPTQSLSLMQSTVSGLTEDEAEKRLRRYGPNEVVRERPMPWYRRLAHSFTNPFSLILVVLALVSYYTDVRMAPPGGASYVKVIMLTSMIALSGLMTLWQEYRSAMAAEKLKAMVHTTATVLRREDDGESLPEEAITTADLSRLKREIPIWELVPGDVVLLAAGDMVPADVRLIRSKDLSISQAALTGESMPVEKRDTHLAAEGTASANNILDEHSLCFMGTNVESGSAAAVVLSTGGRTYFGSMASAIAGPRPLTSFDIGVRKISWVLIRFTAVMVPIVFLINGFTKGNWSDALIFALAVAVGVTPEMMPMIVSANLARGSVAMANKKVIVKRLNAIQNFGAMDILCTDKTGTLTQDKVMLEHHLDVSGNESHEVLRLAFLNSYHQTGLKNLLDRAIIDHAEMDAEEDHLMQYPKIDEIPFDFVRRRMSVVVKNGGGRHLLICKGAVEETFGVSTRVQIDDRVVPLDESVRRDVLRVTANMNEEGMRVVAVACKAFDDSSQKEAYSVADEKDLVLVGYIGFLDPPKDTASETIRALGDYGVDVKILTGDNELVTRKICRDVGLNVKHLVLGSEIDSLNDDELATLAEQTTVFAKLNPLHKSRVIKALRSKGHTVGYMGDGINDAAALKDADVGISVDTAVDIAKESADIILLEKSLTVLRDGVIQGRTVFGNIVKYVKMAASSNFGNMFSVLPASAFLPFLPMMPIHILILNVIYDISQLSLPWDKMDDEFLRKPRKWDASGLTRFMIYIGPCSSVYDLTTFYLMWFIFKGWLQNAAGVYVNAGLFQAGWFVESMMSQTLIIHMIRTQKIPFLQSTATLPVILVTSVAIATVCLIPFTALGAAVGMQPLPVSYWPWLVGMVGAYLVQTQLVKVYYIKKFKGEWLG